MYIFGGLECVGQSFACCPFFLFLRDVWIRTQRAAVASRHFILKRQHPTLLNIKFLYFFYVFGSFLPSSRQKKDSCGSRSETLIKGLCGRRRCAFLCFRRPANLGRPLRRPRSVLTSSPTSPRSSTWMQTSWRRSDLTV
jgi:hypothetical protein